MKMFLRIVFGLTLIGVITAGCGGGAQPTGKVFNVYDYTSCRAEGGTIDNKTPPSCKHSGRIYTARVTRAQ